MKKSLKNILLAVGVLASTNTYFVMATSPQSDTPYTEMKDPSGQPDADVEALTEDLSRTHLSGWRAKVRKYAAPVLCCIAVGTAISFEFWDPAIMTQGGQECAAAAGDWCNGAVKKIAYDIWYNVSELGPECIPFLKMVNDPKGICYEYPSLYQWIVCHRKDGCQEAPATLCYDLWDRFRYDFSQPKAVKLEDAGRWAYMTLKDLEPENPGNATGANVTLAEVFENTTHVKFIDISKMPRN